jgi:ABC-2 type transport system permease protein
MATLVPKTSVALTTLLRADFTTQWRNRRAVVMTLIVPLIILTSWKGMIKIVGGPFVLANSITIGLFALGLMGYSNAIARDRDKGIFQRLRVAPVPPWTIMASRLLVQLAMILIIVTAVFIVGMNFDGIALTPGGYAITYFAAIVSGAVSLSLGQVVVGRIKNPETVNSTSRLIYIAFIMLGIFGELPIDDKYAQELHKIVIWSPYGTIKTLLSGSMEPSKWNTDTTSALLVTLAYIIVFSILGIKWFKWDTKS